VQHGRTMAMIRGSMESENGKTVYATCEHHKVFLPSKPEHMAISLEPNAAMLAEASKL